MARTQSSDTRQRIFDAAARLFAHRRFHEVRMDDLAAEISVGKGTLYRYFHDKDDLYYALITTASEDLLRVVDAGAASPSGPQETLAHIVDGILGFFDRHPYFFDLLQHVEALNVNRGGEFPWSQIGKQLVSRVTAVMAAPELGVHNPRQAALMLLGSIRALVRFGDRPRPPLLAADVVRTFLYGATAAPIDNPSAASNDRVQRTTSKKADAKKAMSRSARPRRRLVH